MPGMAQGVQCVAEFGESNRLDEVRDEAGCAGCLEVFVRAVATEGDAPQAMLRVQYSHEFVTGAIRETEVGDDGMCEHTEVMPSPVARHFVQRAGETLSLCAPRRVASRMPLRRAP